MKTALLVLLASIKAYQPCNPDYVPPTSVATNLVLAAPISPAERLRRMADELERCEKAKRDLDAAILGAEKWVKEGKE